jgi:hypothetical protein
MGDVLEFSTARCRFNRELLRAFGLEKPLLWRYGRRCNGVYEFRGLYTGPLHLASKADEELRVICQLAGRTRKTLSDQEWIKAILDVAVVQSSLAQEGRAWRRTMMSYVFDDGGAMDALLPAADVAPWRERALRMMRSRGVARASTIWVSARLAPCAELLAS